MSAVESVESVEYTDKNIQTSITATESVLSLCAKICQSVFVKLVLVVVSLYVGGLTCFFWQYSTSYTNLISLCYQSNAEFMSSVYADYQEFVPPWLTGTWTKNTHHHHHQQHNLNMNKCEGDVLTCEMERQHDVSWQKTSKTRDHCVRNVRDENFQPRTVPQKIVDRHKHNSLNELLQDIAALYDTDSLSMLLNIHEAKHEFPSELQHCSTQSQSYLTDFAPVIGFHVLCLHHFPAYAQTLVIGYMHGYKHTVLPSIPYKNRRKCVVRHQNHTTMQEHQQQQQQQQEAASSSSSGSSNTQFTSNAIGVLNGTYYLLNDCERLMTAKQPNPKYILVATPSMRDFRKHLQQHFIKDIAAFDDYTMEGRDISDNFNERQTSRRHGDPSQRTLTETEKLYRRLARKRKGIYSDADDDDEEEDDDDMFDDDKGREQTPPQWPWNKAGAAGAAESNGEQHTITVRSAYKKNPFGLFYPNGETISYYLSDAQLFSLDTIVFMFEGGRFMWPGVRRGHAIQLGVGPDIKLTTINMRPLIFSITGLITKGEVAHLRASSLSRLNRSEVGLSAEKKVSESRTCESAWLFGEHDEIVNSLKTRCEKIVQLPKTHMEDIEVIRYRNGQHFDLHYDAFQQHDAASSQSQVLLHGGFKNRIATILYYLSDVDANGGGYTVFPRYDLNIQFDEFGIEKHGKEIILSQEACDYHPRNHSLNDTSTQQKYGLKITPKYGKVILFYNMLPSGELDPAVLHGGCLLKSGQTKWAANQWIWNRPFN